MLHWFTSPPSLIRRVEWLLFGGTFLAFSYFHQGGGWNQNGRFAMVRSIVENGRFSIDSHLIYTGVTRDGVVRLKRIPVYDGRFESQGKNVVLTWTDPRRAGPPHGIAGG